MNNPPFKIRFLSSFFLVVFSHCFYAQEVVWLDENHNQTSASEGMYYRLITDQNKGGNYLIEDYYKSGDLYRTGKAASLTVQKEMFRGFVIYYYKDQSTFKEEKYKNGVLDVLLQELDNSCLKAKRIVNLKISIEQKSDP